MDNELRKKCLELLHKNEEYAKNLDSVKSESERRAIKAFSEDFYLSFIEGLLAAKKAVEEHPDKVAEVAAKHIPKQ